MIFYAVKQKRGRSKPILPYGVLPFAARIFYSDINPVGICDISLRDAICATHAICLTARTVGAAICRPPSTVIAPAYNGRLITAPTNGMEVYINFKKGRKLGVKNYPVIHIIHRVFHREIGKTP